MTWLLENTPASAKRKVFRDQLNSGKLHSYVGAFSPYIALMVETLEFDGVYISGAGISNDLGYPDIGLTTLTEVTQRSAAIAKSVRCPSFVDVDTGFGETMNMARSIRELEDAGLAGCHLEDQVNPKRCGHLDNKGLVSTEEMCRKVKAAHDARTDENFVICARTDSRASEGLEASIERAKSYVDAGADMIFPEALKSPEEFEAFRKAVSVPLLANMTEFGKSELLSRKQLSSLGYNMVIYPMTCFRLAMGAIEEGLKKIKTEGDQKNLLDQMQTRSRLYEYLNYSAYNEKDQNIFNFKLRGDQ